MTRRIHDDVFSLLRLLRIFPFLKHRIVVNDIACLHVFRLLKKHEIEFDLENEPYTRALSVAIGQCDTYLKDIEPEPALAIHSERRAHADDF